MRLRNAVLTLAAVALVIGLSECGEKDKKPQNPHGKKPSVAIKVPDNENIAPNRKPQLRQVDAITFSDSTYDQLSQEAFSIWRDIRQQCLDQFNAEMDAASEASDEQVRDMCPMNDEDKSELEAHEKCLRDQEVSLETALAECQTEKMEQVLEECGDIPAFKASFEEKDDFRACKGDVYYSQEEGNCISRKEKEQRIREKCAEGPALEGIYVECQLEVSSQIFTEATSSNQKIKDCLANIAADRGYDIDDLQIQSILAMVEELEKERGLLSDEGLPSVEDLERYSNLMTEIGLEWTTDAKAALLEKLDLHSNDEAEKYFGDLAGLRYASMIDGRHSVLASHIFIFSLDITPRAIEAARAAE
jgi:hypothetical protein